MDLYPYPLFAIDWDDTLVEDHYPDQGPWLTGAVEALHELATHGDIVIFSCRVSPYAFPIGRDHGADTYLDPAEVKRQVDGIRNRLLSAGLGHIEVWTRPYKPPAAVFIDDRAVRFTGDWEETLNATYKVFQAEARPVARFFDDEELKMAEEARRVSAALGKLAKMHIDGTPRRHPNSQAFHDRLATWGDLHDRKQADYGSDADPFANIRQGAADIGLPGWVGCAIRMRDKMQRILTAAKQYIETGEVSMANESLVDSFDDLGVYSGIGAVLLEEEEVGRL
jgi:hypothetical protein